MKKLRVLIFFVLSIFAISAIAKDNNSAFIPDNELYQVSDYTQSYYIHPKPEKIPYMLNTLDQFGILVDKYHRDPMIAFITEVLKNNPDNIAIFAKQINKNSTMVKFTLYQSIWNSNTVQGYAYLNNLKKTSDPKTRDIINSIMSKPPINILQSDLTPEVLDQLWGSFFATGDNKYLSRITDGLATINLNDLKLQQEPSKLKEAFSDIVSNIGVRMPISMQKKVLYSSAWSLQSNACQNTDLSDKYADIAETKPEPIRTAIAIIINATKKNIIDSQKGERDLIERAKNAESTNSLYNYYLMTGNMPKYIRYLHKASQSGNYSAQSDLGYYYANGWYGLEKNYSLANNWLKKAIASGSSSGLERLGQQYFYGRGVKRDYHLAFNYFEQAAGKKDACGLFMVGKYYTFGIDGIDKNLTLATQWLSLAAKTFCSEKSPCPEDMDAIINFFPSYYIATASNQPLSTSNLSTIYKTQLLMNYFNKVCH